MFYIYIFCISHSESHMSYSSRSGRHMFYISHSDSHKFCISRSGWLFYVLLGRTLSNVVRLCGPTHLLVDYLAMKYY